MTATDTRTVLIGYVLLFDEIIDRGDGELLMVRPTSFKNLMRGPTIPFLHDHDKTMVVGSTEHELTLHVDQKGIAFKLYTPAGTLGEYTRHCVRTNFKEAMSAGLKVTEYENHVVNGKTILMVTKAELLDASLCSRGANDHAFAVLVDDTAEWVTDLCDNFRLAREMDRAHYKRAQRRSGQLTDESAAAGVSRAIAKLIAVCESGSLEDDVESSSFG